MKIANSTFIKLILALAFVSSLFVWSFNFVVDPYGYNNKFIFQGNKTKLTRDERSRKFFMLAEYPNAVSFIFGSSRALSHDPVLVEKLTDTESLNMAFSSASAYEYYLYIKYLIETRDVKNIIIGIDLFSYTKNFDSNGILPAEILDYHHLKSNRSMKSYLSYRMLRRSLQTLKANRSAKDNAPEYANKGRIIDHNFYEAQKNSDTLKSYIENNVTKMSPRWGSKNGELSQEALGYLHEIKELCKTNKINLYLYMSPIYIKQITMYNNRFDQQKKLLKYIAENISPIYDYNSISDINTNPYNYRDVFHFSYNTANAIIENMFHNDKKLKANGFLVTQLNVDSYLENVSNNLQHYLSNKNQKNNKGHISTNN